MQKPEKQVAEIILNSQQLRPSEHPPVIQWPHKSSQKSVPGNILFISHFLPWWGPKVS